ncbi:MAG: PAS domain-containing protein [Bacteroidales bacterium]|nr:PAS domain-containing protein [Bacteroidales bacterium]
MGNNNKTKEQLLKEIDQLRVKIAELEKSENERIRVEEALRKSETRFNEAQRLTQIGSWELDLVTNTLYWSNEIYRMFDLEPKQFGATYEVFLDNIHPDDRAFVDKAYTESVKNKKPYNIVHRLLLSDGTLKFVNERCETFYDDQGNAIRSLGTVQDITWRKQAEEELAKYSEQLEEMVKERTKELEEKNKELDSALKVFVGREITIRDLNNRIRELERK